MKFKDKPTDKEIKALQDAGEIIHHYSQVSGFGAYEAFLQLPAQKTQEFLFKKLGTGELEIAISSTIDEVVLWGSPLFFKSYFGQVGAYTDFFQKLTPPNLNVQRDI